MDKRKEIDLTGSKLHIGLRAFAVNSTRSPAKKDERIHRFERDFRHKRCAHGEWPGNCEDC